MKSFDFLLFDEKAISILVSTTLFQSVEYIQGRKFIQHICGELQSEIVGDIAIEYSDHGIIFSGKREDADVEHSSDREFKIFCVDLINCNILSEKNTPSDLLTVMQKSFRTVLKIWNHQPFTFSERVHGSKSIIFPFVMTDRRRIVIERSNNVPRFIGRGIKQPLLAYKYNAEEPPQGEEIADTHILRVAGELYVSIYYQLQKKFEIAPQINDETINDVALRQITTTAPVGGGGFIYLDFNTQLSNLTESQRFVVQYPNVDSPLRVDGAAGTGKTVSLIMRAYNLLSKYKEKNSAFSMIFFSHSTSTNRRNKEMFERYPDSNLFLDGTIPQTIRFTTLLDFSSEFSGISADSLIERDAGDAKTYQLMLIENVIEKAEKANKIHTYKPLLSSAMQDVFNPLNTPKYVLYSMLQHEFSIQIKGRTDCTIDTYYEIPSIKNGLPCQNKKDKEFIFSLFNAYQDELKSFGSFDVDDVTMEALAHLNAPVWRRERVNKGYDYIIVDEMHLFNVNEQSVFHFLTKSLSQKDIPICFALDYSQAIGDRGDVGIDYIEKAFGNKTKRKKYRTIFRNSPQIANFCASIAASGTLMFQESFSNPYDLTQSNFTESEEEKSSTPVLYMYNNDNDMLKSLATHIGNTMKALQCKPNDIAVISFDPKFLTDKGISKISKITKKEFELLDFNHTPNVQNYILASPYDINGLEFKAVILLGVDEGRVPQTTGTSDISKHFIKYSAYNLLYLASSRAKYELKLLGNKLNGVSSCLEHSLKSGQLEKIDS